MSDKKEIKNKSKHCKHCLCYKSKDDLCLAKGIKNCSIKCEYTQCNDFKWNDRITMY